MGTQLFDETSPIAFGQDYIGTGNPDLQNLVPQQQVDLRIDVWTFVSHETVSRVFDVFCKTPTGTDIQIGSITVPAGAGLLATLATDAIAGLTVGQSTGIVLPRGWQLDWGVAVGITSGTHIMIRASGGVL